MRYSVLKGIAYSFSVLAVIILIFYFTLPISIIAPEDKRISAARQVYVKNSVGNQIVGKTKSMVNDDANHAVSIHYPITGITEIDRVIECEVFSKLTQFQRKKIGYQALAPNVSSSVWIDYESYIKGDTISVILHTEEKISVLAHPLVSTCTLVFQANSAEQLHLDDVLKGNYLPVLAELAKEQLAANPNVKDQMETIVFADGTEQNYQYFALKEEGIIIYFDKYQTLPSYFRTLSVTIPYEQLSDYLNIDLSDAQSKAVQTIALPKEGLIQPQPFAIDKQKPMIALTFDDGPHHIVTPRILDVLQAYNARATFFVLGNRVDSFPNIIQREYIDGHEIGSHSFSHPQITTLTVDEIKYQFEETENRIQQYVPDTTQLVRPPYGQITQSLKDSVSKTFVLWSVDTQDWRTKNKDAIISEVLNNVKDGDIILMHDLFSTTADACQAIIPMLIEQGYQLVTVSELLNAKEIMPAAGSVYKRASTADHES